MAKRPAKFEVKCNSADRWYYHEKINGRIKNVGQSYTRREGCIRAACREALEQPGSMVHIWNKDLTAELVLTAEEMALKAMR